ncbi:MAG: phenylalanine--tRNA ligase beta subunit-related protein [Acidobacteriota bacterium]|nr:phenylalanine--tRNA ligase beta subunit-related protein [Acidobacteriota bacterium]MDQ7088908.1 phenylalanine--tRNA ligase beta subunit-related protein [Acidobacteriota bacterium]
MVIDTVSLDREVQGILKLGLVAVTFDTAPSPAAITPLLDEAVARLRRAENGRSAGRIPRLGPARRLYRAFGLDPTRRRPSPEALIRRLLKGQAFPRIHPAVDLANCWAIESGLPVGLYDTAHVRGAVRARRGRDGESYTGIRRGEIHLDGRPVLADAEGPFGNPSADSLRTSVGETSRDLLYVLFAPEVVPGADLEGWIRWLDTRAAERLGARTVTRIVD